MTIKKLTVPLAALALGVGTASLATAQAGERHHRQPSQNSERSREGGASRPEDQGANDRDQRAERRANRESRAPEQNTQRAETPARAQRQSQGGRDQRAEQSRQERSEPARQDGRHERNRRGDSRDARNSNSSSYARGRDQTYRDSAYDRDGNRGNARDSYRGNPGRGYNGYSRDYYAPRLLRRGYSSRHSYGTGGRASLYFGIGSGYRYGSPYSGRVYGYRRPVPSYGRYVSYGDIRLKDFPRDGAVYVDGYYAGIVDDFDGFFQRLTLEVGPHEVEVVVPGDESQFFDVYVDPYNTIDLHADWRR